MDLSPLALLDNKRYEEDVSTLRSVLTRLGRRFNERQAFTLAVFLVIAGIVAAHNLHPLTTAPSRRAGWRLFREPKRHWTVEFPATWHAQRIADSRHMSPYSPSEDGILISNVNRRFGKEHLPPNSWTPWFDTSRAPSTLVVLQVVWFYSAGFDVRPCEDTALPLTLANAKRSKPYGRHDADQTQLQLESIVVQHSAHYSVVVILGPKVTAHDRATVEAIVRSISFDHVVPDYPTGTSCSNLG